MSGARREPVCVIVNPAAGRGRGRRVLPAVRAAFAGIGVTDFRETKARGDEESLARRAIAEGCTTIVAVGGDGTWGRVAHAMLTTGAEVRLALVAAGTGNDFAKSAKIPASDVGAVAALVASGAARRVDVGHVNGRYFLNTSGFGFDVAVLRSLERVRWLRGNAVYLYASLRQLFGFRGVTAAMDEPDVRPASRYLMVVVSNGRYFGGAFLIAPGASVTDGALDATLFGPASPLRRLRLFAASTRGAHGSMAGVETIRERRVVFRFDERPWFEVDGETFRSESTVLDYVALPRALTVVAEPNGEEPRGEE